jgi:hypothetical protein
LRVVGLSTQISLGGFSSHGLLLLQEMKN